MHRPRLLAAGAALAATLAIAGPSAAAVPKDVTYHVTTEMTGTWEHHWARDSTSAWARFEDYKLGFTVKAYYQDVAFHDGLLKSVDLKPIQDATVDVTLAKMQYIDPIGTELFDCDQNEEISAIGDARLESDPVVGIETANLLFRPARTLAVLMDCGMEDEHRGVDLLGGSFNEQELGFGPLDINWDVPFAALGKDYVEHLVTPTAAQQKVTLCPGYDESYTVSCKIDWTAKIIMRKAEPEGGGGTTTNNGGGGNGQVISPPVVLTEDDITPLPTGPPKPPTQNTGTVPPSTPTPGKGRLSRDRRHVTFTITCPAGKKPCTVAAGGRRVVVKAGTRKALTVKLAHRAKAGTVVKVPITITVKGAKPVKTTVKVKA